MKWFREGPSPYQTALAMIGARRGQRVVVIGAGSGPLAAEVALVTGLNGQVLVIDRNPASEAAVLAAAANAGALMQFERAPSSMLPVGPEACDIAVLHAELGGLGPADARLALAEARRILRPGGRTIVIERAPRPGLFGSIRIGAEGKPPLRPDAVIELLKSEGFLAVRLLAESEGTSYVEGRRS